MILIQNAKPFDVLVADGKIKKTGKISEKADQVVDGKGLVVVPGLIDMHVHFREPGREDKETIRSGSEAAIAGGFTSVAVMANSGRVCDDAVGVVYVNAKSKEAGGANVYAVGAVTKGLKGEELAELGKMSEAGAVAFSDDGMPILNSELMRRALEYSKMFSKPILSHCEDATLTRGFVMNEGKVSAKLGLRGYPNAAEAAMAARDCYLAALTGGHVHICHLSAKETVDVVRRAKKAGIRVTAEAAPHHLMLTDESLVNYESKYKMNPPLRTREDVDAVIEGVVDGTIDAIASDHAPHTAEEKEQELAACPNGIIGLETTLGVVLSIKKIPFDRAIEAMTSAPAEILGLGAKGTLKAGADADLTLIDPKASWTVDPSAFKSMGRCTPYEKMKLTGRAAHVLVGGRLVFLIDGYNLLHCFAREKTGDDARTKLISLIEGWCARGNYRARIVFDPTGGMKRNDQRGAVQIRNVPQGVTADDEILTALQETDDRTQYTVVSNDLAIVKAAGKRGFTVVPCEEFARTILTRAEPSEKGDTASPGEVDYWMREFGFDDEELT